MTNTMKYLILSSFFFLTFLVAPDLSAQEWSIEVVADGYQGDAIYLAYYLGNSQYIQDTAQRDQNKFRFSGTGTLHSGVYMVVFPPDNQFFQLLIADGEEQIVVKVNMEDVQHPYFLRGSKESKLFYEYVGYLQSKRPLADTLRKAVEKTEDADAKKKLREEARVIDAEVKNYQSEILDKHPETLTALLIRSHLETEAPEFQGTDEEIQMQTYRFVKAHYFDKLPMMDERLVRTPVLHQKIEYFVNKLTPQVPDSINQSLDFILSQFDPTSEAFKIYLVYFLNQYAKSKIVGMDAVYVHLVENYYAKDLATWTDSLQLNKIIRNAETLKPLLIGKIAPDLLMLTRDNKPIRLHNISSPYTVLFFWDPDCGHCKKSMPDVIEFYKTYKPRGVEIFSVCTRLQDDVPKCWESIDEQDMGTWINVVDPYLRSRFKQIYDVRTTPQIYILDKDKKIIMKKIGAEQLPEVMDRLMENGS
ncbi:MAG TPA: redoxin domain-containing protein [Saprospiraceae bacterium]|nr:redoxin domain-containing protein [Saprospiraceae bacterium]